MAGIKNTKIRKLKAHRDKQTGAVVFDDQTKYKQRKRVLARYQQISKIDQLEKDMKILKKQIQELI